MRNVYYSSLFTISDRQLKQLFSARFFFDSLKKCTKPLLNDNNILLYPECQCLTPRTVKVTIQMSPSSQQTLN